MGKQNLKKDKEDLMKDRQDWMKGRADLVTGRMDLVKGRQSLAKDKADLRMGMDWMKGKGHLTKDKVDLMMDKVKLWMTANQKIHKGDQEKQNWLIRNQHWMIEQSIGSDCMGKMEAKEMCCIVDNLFEARTMISLQFVAGKVTE